MYVLFVHMQWEMGPLDALWSFLEALHLQLQMVILRDHIPTPYLLDFTHKVKKKNGRFDHTNQTVPPHRLHLFFISFITPWAGPTGGLLLPMPSWTTFTEADFDGLLVRSEQM